MIPRYYHYYGEVMRETGRSKLSTIFSGMVRVTSWWPQANLAREEAVDKILLSNQALQREDIIFRRFEQI